MSQKYDADQFEELGAASREFIRSQQRGRYAADYRARPAADKSSKEAVQPVGPVEIQAGGHEISIPQTVSAEIQDGNKIGRTVARYGLKVDRFIIIRCFRAGTCRFSAYFLSDQSVATS